MASASDAHVKVAGNTYALIKSHLRDSSCSTYIADMKVSVNEGEAFFYPDVMVTCDPSDQQPERNYTKQCPKLIIEVLSPSTESKDRGSKFQYYRQLASLEDYVLINPNAYYVELFHRHNEHEWLLSSYQGLNATLTLTSIKLSISLSDLYEDVRFEQ